MIDQKIYDFLKEHHVLNLATCRDNCPYCSNCFYAFDDDNFRFVIASDTKTRHLSEAIENPNVSGSIYLETKEIGKIQGLQFTAILKEADKTEKKLYYKSFPYALAMQPQLWTLHVKYIKFTDNKLGFGKKLEYNLNEK